MRKVNLILATIFIFSLWGCTPPSRMFDMYGYNRPYEFPGGGPFGGATSDQAQSLAELLVESHNMHMSEFGQIKAMESENLATARQTLAQLQELSRSQGSGEITLFFATGSARLNRQESDRLIRFSDYISRESRGRKVFFVLVGSASSTGSRRVNERLSMDRAREPIDVIDKYLINVPHEFYAINGIGDMYSPQGVSMKEHQRYQNVRIIAAYGPGELAPYTTGPSF